MKLISYRLISNYSKQFNQCHKLPIEEATWQSDPPVHFCVMEHATTYCNVNSIAQFPAAIGASGSATHFGKMLSTPQLAKRCFLLGVFKNRVPLYVTSIISV